MSRIVTGQNFIKEMCKAYNIPVDTVRAIKIEADIQNIVTVTFVHTMTPDIWEKTVPMIVPKQEISNEGN